MTWPLSNGEIWTHAQQHWKPILFVLLIVGILGAYAPVFRMGFTTDDYIEIGARHFDALDSFPAQDWNLWLTRFADRAFIDPVTGWQIFRPVRQWLFWSDYVMWHLSPLGYHITNLILHLLTSFLVALIAWRITRRQWTAMLAGLLFAMLSIHAGPVAGISSRGHVMAGLFVALSMFFYLLPRRPLTLGLSLLGFVLALGSKETGAILPGLLLLYEWVRERPLHRTQVFEILRRQLPFWIVLGGYLLIRLAMTGQVASSPYALGRWDGRYQLAGYLEYTFDPFLTSLTSDPTFLALAVYLFAVWAYRKRRIALFGLLWIPLALLPTLTFPPQDRYFYTPSIGVALALAGILADPIPVWTRLSRLLGLGLLLLLVSNYGLATSSLLEDYVRSSQVVTRFLGQVRAIHPTFPPEAKIYVVGLPERVKRGYVLSNPLQIQYALQLEYDDRSMQVIGDEQFPLVAQDPDRTFFLQYDNGKVIDRTDLLQSIQTRRRCVNKSSQPIVWNFEKESEGWEAWNDISEWQIQEGQLIFQSTGKDPFIASPVLEIAPRNLGPIEIRMAVRSAQAIQHGEVYWQTSDMADFSPDLKVAFPITADGEWHTYTLDLPLDKVAMNAPPLVRLRFDPAEAAAQVRIESIRISCQ